jgi:hypothetical protein
MSATGHRRPMGAAGDCSFGSRGAQAKRGVRATDRIENIWDFRFAVLVCVIDALCAARSMAFPRFLCAINGLVSDFARPVARPGSNQVAQMRQLKGAFGRDDPVPIDREPAGPKRAVVSLVNRAPRQSSSPFGEVGSRSPSCPNGQVEKHARLSARWRFPFSGVGSHAKAARVRREARAARAHTAPCCQRGASRHHR